MAGVLEHAVGTWGLWFVSIGLIISALGAYLALDLTSALTLIPFFLAALFALKLVFTREGFSEGSKPGPRDWALAILATCLLYTSRCV